MKTKKDGFYMNVTNEEREIIRKLQEEYAVNISQAFKIFLKKALEEANKWLTELKSK